MVDSVVGRSVQNPLEWTEATNHFSVNPELVKQVELLVHDVGWCRDKQGHGKVEELNEAEG